MDKKIKLLNDIANKNIDEKTKIMAINYIINSKIEWVHMDDFYINKEHKRILFNAFYWVDTQQGYNFWEDIHSRGYLENEIIFKTEQQFIDCYLTPTELTTENLPI